MVEKVKNEILIDENWPIRVSQLTEIIFWLGTHRLLKDTLYGIEYIVDNQKMKNLWWTGN